MTATESVVEICPRCGGQRPPETKPCPFCGSELAPCTRKAAGVSRSVQDAIEVWGRSVPGAPGGLAALVTRIEPSDEVLERVLTDVVRRHVYEQRLPTNRKGLVPPRVNVDAVEPFHLSLPELRAQSEHVAPCNQCNGAGLGACGMCNGSRRAWCTDCNGTGKTLKYYKTTTREIKCKGCRGSGTVKCVGCGASGTIVCAGCAGSGHQLAWLAYQETSALTVVLEPDSPVARAHPQLSEARFLSSSDLDAFSILTEANSDGRIELEGYRTQESSPLRAIASALDPRLERIRRQQYHRLAVIRRDVHFQMCGGEDTVVLSGRDLDARTNAVNTRLFRRRRSAWFASAILTFLIVSLAAGRLMGRAVYFHTGNSIIVGFSIAGALMIAFGLGGVLRALRPKLAFWSLRVLEKRVLILGSACLALLPLLSFSMRPRVSELKTALASNATARAHEVVDALIEIHGDSGDVADASDELSLAEAKRLDGDHRLQALDRVGARGGSLSAGARAEARSQRLASLDSLLGDQNPTAVLNAIDRWWPQTWRSDPEVAEMRARANDLAMLQCDTAPCRFAQATLAANAVANNARHDATAKARQSLLEALSTSELPNEAALTRLQRLRKVALTAMATSALKVDDDELNATADKAAAWSAAERAKVPLIGAEVPVIEELLGKTATTDTHGLYFALGTNRAFLVLDGAKKCRGIYLVGDRASARTIGVNGAEALLSQATGHPTAVKTPTSDSPTQVRWFDVNAMITARWKDTALIELRIGDAAP